MSTQQFYRDQAELQSQAAEAAKLDNVRDQCARAAQAWTKLATHSQRVDEAREAQAAKLLNELSENPDRGMANGDIMLRASA